MTDYTKRRLGELVELALEDELIESCHVTRDAVVIGMCGRQLTFTNAEARAFLGSLVQGWTRSKPTAQPEGSDKPAPSAATPGVRRRSIFMPTPAGPGVTTGQDTLVSNEVLHTMLNGASSNTTDEAYVDAVLACAEKLRLIEGYNKDRASHRIVLRTKATTTDMSYFETLEYLTGSILEELRIPSNA